jgi:ATP-dependent Clp protease ATP-binding subunit ClpX
VPPQRDRIYCSFCGLNDQEVPDIILGFRVAICCHCVDLCAEIIREKVAARGGDERGFGDYAPTPS